MEDRRRILVAATDVLTVLKRGSGERRSRGGSKSEPATQPTTPTTPTTTQSTTKPTAESTDEGERNANRDVDLSRKTRPGADLNNSEVAGNEDLSSQEDVS
jgi:hypothetical protein